MQQPSALTIETAPWKYASLIAARDVTTTAKLGACLFAAALPPRRWPAVSRLLARTHLRIRGGAIHRLERPSAILGRDARSLAEEALTADYLSNIRTLKEILPGGWSCETPLVGRDILDTALQRSRGAVLWCSPFVGSDLAPKKALALAGYSLTHLSSPFHPFGDSRFGGLLLNPIRLRAVNRYLARRVLVVYGNAKPALDALRRVLADNGVVTIMAVGTGRTSVSLPFMGGTTQLGAGAPRLAYQTGAALIPTFTLPEPNGGYRVELGPVLQPRRELPEREAVADLAARYVEQLETVVRAHPAHWEGWFMSTWRPST